MKQGLVLSPVLSALYLALVLHILEKCLENLKIPVFILSFVNNSLFIVQSKSLTISNLFLFCSYSITSSLLKKFRLIIKHSKTEVFHFSRSYGVFNPSLLDLFILEGLILYPRET